MDSEIISCLNYGGRKIIIVTKQGFGRRWVIAYLKAQSRHSPGGKDSQHSSQNANHVPPNIIITMPTWLMQL
jgi:hypothetical protein